MSMDELEHAHTEQVVPKGLGAWLRQSRERAGMSVEEVARALKLSGSTVQDMERDRTDHIGAPIYYKGFVRAYGKLLDLPSVALESRLSALVDTDPVPQIAQGTAPVRRNRWLERYTWAASYVVGTALLLPLLYWLVSSDGNQLAKQLQRSDSNTVSTPAVADRPAAATPTEPAAAAAEPSQPIMQPQPQADEQVSADESYPAPVTASLTPFGLGRGAAVSQAASTGSSLQLKLSAPSWVSVENAAGERLIYRTLAAGEHNLDAGMLPLRVRIGNAARAELFIEGQALALEPYVRGNVAELALRSSEQGITAVRPQD